MRYQKKKSYKYKLFEFAEFNLYHDFGFVNHDLFQICKNKMVIRKNYTWDGATSIPDTDKNFCPALIHDVLAQCMREGLMSIDMFNYANQELRLQYIERGGWSWWGRVLSWGTNTFGKRFFKSNIIEVK